MIYKAIKDANGDVIKFSDDKNIYELKAPLKLGQWQRQMSEQQAIVLKDGSIKVLR